MKVPVILIASLTILTLVSTASCLFSAQSESNSIIANANKATSAQIKWLGEEKFKEPAPSAPLEIVVDSVESSTRRIGRYGGIALDTTINIGAVGVMGAGLGGDGGVSSGGG
jgi:hypothetical protein